MTFGSERLHHRGLFHWGAAGVPVRDAQDPRDRRDGVWIVAGDRFYRQAITL